MLALLVVGAPRQATAQLITSKVSITAKAVEVPHESGPGPHTLALQVGAFASAENAGALRKRLEQRFAHVSVTPFEHRGAHLYRVRVEGLDSPHALELAAASLRNTGLAPFRADNPPAR